MADNQNIRQTNDFRLGNGEDYLLVYAKNVKKDINRTIDSLGFIDHDLPDDLNDLDIDGQIDIVNKKLLSIDEKIDNIKEKYKDLIDNIDYNLNFNKKASEYKDSMAFGDKYFYFSAEVPESDLERVENCQKNIKIQKLLAKVSK